MIPELALPSIRARIEQIDELTVKIGDEPDARLVHEMVVFGHELADLIVCSASAAYTVSIQHYERLFLHRFSIRFALLSLESLSLSTDRLLH
ncbi:unnamed protein product [Anisakis simplex]|uniref:FCD domain-containing protein n=1 Tax=Anisakis simplex TaxID=6269 RepID=A0A0M3JBJ8_ANISI|nr:unnamed protein product [Anisakis simplex]